MRACLVIKKIWAISPHCDSERMEERAVVDTDICMLAGFTEAIPAAFWSGCQAGGNPASCVA